MAGSANTAAVAARRGAALTLAILLIALARGAGQPDAAEAANPIEYTRFDVALDVRDDGSFHVRETQEVYFHGGPYQNGFRSIPLARVEAISNVRVAEIADGETRAYEPIPFERVADAPQWSYSFTGQISSLFLTWRFEPTSFAARTFVVEYDVIGALRVYADATPPNQQVWWTAVGSELTAENRVSAATMTVTLPQAVDLAQVTIGNDGRDNPRDYSGDGRVFRWEHGAFDSGEAFEPRVQFPPVVAGALPPAWQAADDAQRARAAAVERRQASVNLVLLGAGLLLLTGGGAGVYGLWYMRGRDPSHEAGLVTSFLPEPPDDLPPGAAGTLLDERADECDVIATVLDLARRGVLKINERKKRDFRLTLVDADLPVAPFEAAILRALFGPGARNGASARLSEVHDRFVDAKPEIKEKLYAELVTRGYFPRSPEATRGSWKTAGLVAAGAAVFVGAVATFAFGGFALFPTIVAAALAVVVVKLSRSMPRKTRAGAEAAAKWRAFRRYLESIETYERVAEAKDFFDRYLSYAVAFGVERSWVTKFASVDADLPKWYGPLSGSSSGRGTGSFDASLPGDIGRLAGGGSSGEGGSDGGSVKLPNLQKSSDRASNSLQSSSNGFFELLGVAAAVLDVFSGGSSGGSSGGGGGGFK